MASFIPGRSLRVVMIGRTGVGKSAVGNTIVGGERFESRPATESVTTTCQREETTWRDRLVTVVDTPGILDTHQTEEFIQREIVRCVQVSCPGPHVFLLVIQAGRFTREEKNSVEALQELFGPRADQFMMVLFTRGGDLDSSIQDYVAEGEPELRRVIRRCGSRFHVFENSSSDREQVEDLFRKIEEMVAANGGTYYTNEMYEEVEAARRAAQPVQENQYQFIASLVRRIRNFLNILNRD